MPASSSHSSPAGGYPQKSVLFCPDCSHESPPDGDWEFHPNTSGLAVRCPVCGSVLTTRSRERQLTLSPSTATVGQTPVTSLGGRFVARSVGVALGLVTWPCDVVPFGYDRH